MANQEGGNSEPLRTFSKTADKRGKDRVGLFSEPPVNFGQPTGDAEHDDIPVSEPAREWMIAALAHVAADLFDKRFKRVLPADLSPTVKGSDGKVVKNGVDFTEDAKGLGDELRAALRKVAEDARKVSGLVLDTLVH